MPVGKPDDGFNQQAAAASQTDTGYLGDRILMGGGSVSKTGRVIWASGFENGAFTDMTNAATPGQVITVALGNNGTGIAGTGITSWQGNYHAYMQTQAVLNDTATIFKYFPAALITGRWGVEAMVQFMFLSEDFDFRIRKVGPSGIPGAVTQIGVIRIHIGASRNDILLQYQDDTGAFVTFDDLSNILAVGTNVWYNIKVVFDFNADQYVRVLFNNHLYDLTGNTFQHTAPGIDDKSDFRFNLSAGSAAAVAAGVDNVILTADEP